MDNSLCLNLREKTFEELRNELYPGHVTEKLHKFAKMVHFCIFSKGLTADLSLWP